MMSGRASESLPFCDFFFFPSERKKIGPDFPQGRCCMEKDTMSLNTHTSRGTNHFLISLLFLESLRSHWIFSLKISRAKFTKFIHTFLQLANIRRASMCQTPIVQMSKQKDHSLSLYFHTFSSKVNNNDFLMIAFLLQCKFILLSFYSQWIK